MGPIVGFLTPFLEYMRPTKSPYSIICLIAVMFICFYIKTNPGKILYKPEFFVPVYLSLFVVVPLSLYAPRPNSKDSAAESPITPISIVDISASGVKESGPEFNNSKFENDIDSVFKFSRAVGLASGIVMLYYYSSTDRPWDFFSETGYAIIILQMTTFVIYLGIRHFRGEDISNNNLFQIGFMTTTIFCGATFSALTVESGDGVDFIYRCTESHVQISGLIDSAYYQGCEIQPKDPAEKIEKIVTTYRPDFRQITFLIFSMFWLVYEIFWISVLVRIFRERSDNVLAS